MSYTTITISIIDGITMARTTTFTDHNWRKNNDNNTAITTIYRKHNSLILKHQKD
jgi:hypothetical protein